MALAYLVAGVCLLIGSVLWAEDDSNQHKLLPLVVIVGIACIIVSFLVVGGLHL